MLLQNQLVLNVELVNAEYLDNEQTRNNVCDIR
jgi:hypothetical protein